MAARTTSPALTPALIAKMSPGGRGARGALSYDADKDGSRLLWTNLEGATPRQWARQMKAFLSVNPRCRRGVDHVSLSLDPRLGTLTDDQWIVAVKAWLKSMGYGDRAVVCHLHTDEPQQHIHLVVCRTDAFGKVHADGGNWKRSHTAAMHAAEAIGLQPLPPRPEAAWSPAPTDAQTGANKRAGRRGTKVQNHASLARAFDHIVSKSSTLAELELKLREVDIEFQIVRKSGGVIQGLNIREVGAVEWEKASGLKSDRSLGWPKVEARLAANLELHERAQAQAEQVAVVARERAVQRVVDRLGKHPDHQIPQQVRALPPDAIRKAKEAAAIMNDDKLDFLNVPPPPRPDGMPLDDIPMVAASAARANTDKGELLERIERERAAANVQVEEELRSATKTQLKRLREALAGELQAHDAEAIEQMLTRFTRLVLRLLTLNQVLLPPTESERRVHVVRHSLKLVDAEVQRRADVEVRHSAASQPPRVPRTQPAPEKLQIVRAHDPRRPPPDRDEVARKQDAERERNRK